MLTPLFYSTPDLRVALRLVWMALTLGMACAVAAPFVLPAEIITRLVPQCESKRLYGRECVLCGATTGFIAIARGDLRGAADANRLAIPLFAAFSLNTAAAAAYLIRKALRPAYRSTACKY